MTNSVTEIYVHEEAFVDYYKLQNDLPSASLIDNTYITQEKNSHASVHTFALGGKLIRNNLRFLSQRGTHPFHTERSYYFGRETTCGSFHFSPPFTAQL